MSIANAPGAISRITKEVAHIQKGDDLSIAVAFRDDNVRYVRALIVGPPDTAYEYGFFEFDVHFGIDYPIKPPTVKCITTNRGRCRFNPNIYAGGKVCLSILGTWTGERGEQWSSAQGLESVLLSIQSLLSSNPFENEPGFENTPQDDKSAQAYIAKIRHETLRITVIDRMEELLGINVDDGHDCARKRPRLLGSVGATSQTPMGSNNSDHGATGGLPSGAKPPTELNGQDDDMLTSDQEHWDPFSDHIMHRFLWHYDTYNDVVERRGKEQKDGSKFARMPFEGRSNEMLGHFDYKGLRSRLSIIRQELEQQRRSWSHEGQQLVIQASNIAYQLQYNFQQLRPKWDSDYCRGSRLELSLAKPNNPFVWKLVFFGKAMTNLDGGIFHLTLSIPPKFPDAQPFVTVDTAIFHHRVSPSTGILCYFASKPEEIESHLQAIVESLEDENPTYDPRTVVNPAAFNLYWAGDEGRKKYNRELRKSARESLEN